MKNVWSIFKQDLKNIRRVPFVGILLLGLAVLPALYAWFNLGSAWDPYANTEGIQIAVVNEDEGAEVEGEYINIGKQLVKNLEDNEELGWEISSRQEAEDGVKHGDYYAGIYINRTFSEDLTQVINGEPLKPEVLYQVNEKVNAIAPKMTSAGATAIVTEINEQFIGETSKVLFKEFNRLGIQLEEELPRMRKIKQVVYELEKRFPEINSFAEILIEVEENWGKIDSSIEQFLGLEEYFPAIHSSAELILRLDEQFPYINQLGEEVLKLEQTIPELEQAIEDVNGLGESFSDVADRLEWALMQAQSAQATIIDLQETVPVLIDKRGAAEEYVEFLQEFSREVEDSIDSVSEIILQQLYFINQSASTVDQTLALIDDVESTDEVEEVLRHVNEQLLSSMDVIDNTIKLYTMLYEATQDDNIPTMINQLTTLQNVLKSLQQEMDHLLELLEQEEELDMKKVEEVRQKAQEVEASSNHIASLLKNEWADSVKNAYAMLLNDLTHSKADVENAYHELDTIGEMLDQAEEVTMTGEEILQELLNTLPDVEDRVAQLEQKIQNGFPKVINIIETSARFIKEDLPLIESRVNHMAGIIENDLPDAEQKYVKLAGILKEEAPEVKASLSEINDFSRTYLPKFEEAIYDTADQLREMEEEDWIAELISVLRNDLEEESDFFASPVDLKEEKLFHIPNYGSANAPFYTVLSIWVGALLLSNLMTTNLHPADRREGYTLRQIYFGKMILFLIVGVLQGVIVSTGNLHLLGIYAAHPFLLVIFSVIIAVIFMTIVYTLVSILGNIGKALAIVLLVLQLSSSGGTFPIDVAPPFFQAIHPFMPFTYAIDLLREAIGGVIPWLVWKNIGLLVVFWFFAFIVGVLLKPILSDKIEKSYQKSKSSRLID